MDLYTVDISKLKDITDRVNTDYISKRLNRPLYPMHVYQANRFKLIGTPMITILITDRSKTNKGGSYARLITLEERHAINPSKSLLKKNTWQTVQSKYEIDYNTNSTVHDKDGKFTYRVPYELYDIVSRLTYIGLHTVDAQVDTLDGKCRIWFDSRVRRDQIERYLNPDVAHRLIEVHTRDYQFCTLEFSIFRRRELLL